MPLIECIECKKLISDNAIHCPDCGFTLKKKKLSTLGKIMLCVFILFNLSILASGIHAWFFPVTTDPSGIAMAQFVSTVFIGLVWIFGNAILLPILYLTRAKRR